VTGFASELFRTRAQPLLLSAVDPVFELQCAMHFLACMQWRREMEEHQVRRSRLELKGLAGSDLDAARGLTHLRHAIVDRCLVNLEKLRDAHRAADQAIGRRSAVFDLNITAADGRSFGSLAGPWSSDLERPERVLGGQRDACHQDEDRRTNPGLLERVLHACDSDSG
jgi:hypothetical protein